MIDEYNPTEIEKKWQKIWADEKLYEVKEDSTKPKWYALTMFPYTSGDLHIGHWYAMAPSDVYARFKRMQGFNVLHPMGFDSFGLPAENAAIKRGIHPYKVDDAEHRQHAPPAQEHRARCTIGAARSSPASRNIINGRSGFSSSCTRHGLAYRSKAPVNWCPKCQVVLANEQVENGLCWRCETPVVKRDLEQWLFRITKYADELMEHNDIDWPERIKIMQRNWVGKSEGTEISFALDYPGVAEKEIKVFTTRPDTVFGVTFMVLAPEHPLVAKLTTPDKKAEVEAYIDQDPPLYRDRAPFHRKGKGRRFHRRLCHQQTHRRKSPGLDCRLCAGQLRHRRRHGRAGARRARFRLRQEIQHAHQSRHCLRRTGKAKNWQQAYIEDGTMVNSGQFNGLTNRRRHQGRHRISGKEGLGQRHHQLPLRDWLISRQRYWGAPIPMIYCPKCGIVPVPEKDLPVLLPEEAEFRPTGESPLKYNEKFVNTTCPKCGGPAKRETDTIDGFHVLLLVFPALLQSARQRKRLSTRSKMKYWMPVDIYTGGAEHAVMHLLYARFFTKAIRDMGLIDFGEPFKKLFNQGIIIADHQKMSKSKGNVVNPDAYVNELGADTVRAYMMFIGPWEQGGEWFDTGISGVSRWLNRVWNLALEEYEAESE